MMGWRFRGSTLERGAFNIAYYSGLSRLTARLSHARGAICMFHRVVPDRDSQLATDLCTTPAFLDKLLANFRRADIDVIGFEELPTRLAGPAGRRFVVMTFDDGYRDNLDCALPVFEKYSAPMTVYVTDGFVTRSVNCWWLGLERLFLEHDVVEIEAMERRWEVSTVEAKRDAYEECCAWVVASDDTTRALDITDTCARQGVALAGLVDQAFIDVDELRRLGAHPLVTIGGHTHSHPELSKLSEAQAAEEIGENKRYLEYILQCPVHHFAYPHGSCGAREARLTRSVGYRTAVTTEHGCLRDDGADPHLLPRTGIQRRYESVSLMRSQVDGIFAAQKSMRFQMRRFLPVQLGLAQWSML